MFPLIIGLIFILAAFSGALSGSMEAVAAQSAGAAADAVKNVITMAGGICFWSGIMEIMGECGLSEWLTRLLRRPIFFIYDSAADDREACGSIGRNMAANLLGLGSAATPAGLEAAGRLEHLYRKGVIGRRPLMTLAVLNTVSIQLIPSTAASIRAALGSSRPYAILVPVWCASACSFASALAASRLLTAGRR